MKISLNGLPMDFEFDAMLDGVIEGLTALKHAEVAISRGEDETTGRKVLTASIKLPTKLWDSLDWAPDTNGHTATTDVTIARGAKTTEISMVNTREDKKTEKKVATRKRALKSV